MRPDMGTGEGERPSVIVAMVIELIEVLLGLEERSREKLKGSFFGFPLADLPVRMSLVNTCLGWAEVSPGGEVGREDELRREGRCVMSRLWMLGASVWIRELLSLVTEWAVGGNVATV